jgi:putative ABC transport system substrate-binding protein
VRCGSVGRRTVLKAGALLCLPAVAATAQARIYRVGLLSINAAPTRLVTYLRELGYVEGRNLVIEFRDTGGVPEKLDPLARELAKANVDVIIANYPAATIALERATSTIPIVMVNTPDPVELRLVASLSRPGGNITGMTSLTLDVCLKQVQLLKEAVPKASRFAVLWNPDNPWHPLLMKALPRSAEASGVQVLMRDVRDAKEIPGTISTVAAEGAQGLVVLADPMFSTHWQEFADLAVQKRMPSIGGLRRYAEAGGLMSYWADEDELYRKVAGFVDRILKGARPAQLPIEQPTRYELVVNMKTARALGHTMPPALLLRATVLD